MLSLRQPRAWPLLLVCCLPANVSANLEVGKTLWTALGYAFTNGVDGILAAALFRAMTRDKPPLSTLPHALGFLGLSVLGSSMLTAVLGAAVTVWAFPGSSFSWVWTIWLTSNALGILVVAPLILTWRESLARLRSARTRPEAILLVASTLLVLALSFGTQPSTTMAPVLPLFVFPVLVWSALRFGPSGAAMSSALVSAVTVGATAAGVGPLAHLSSSGGQIQFAVQLYVGVGAATTLILAALLAERAAAERALRESQARLFQSQKMETIGQLAGGLAHDFNNLLMVILVHAEMLQQDRSGPKAKEDLERIHMSATRAAALTRRLLGLARKQSVVPTEVSLLELVQDARGLLGGVLGRRIELRAEAAPGCAAVWADRTQLEQALMNLVLNARDAMPEGGVIQIRAENVEGGEVALSVEDTGSGMSAEIQAQIFEAFFTTKPEGTGLGLPMVQTIVRQWQGRIRVESSPGRGTKFWLIFPAVVAPDQRGAPSLSLSQPMIRP